MQNGEEGGRRTPRGRLGEIAGSVKEIDAKLYANDGEVSSFKRKIDTAEAELKGVMAAASKGDTKAVDRVKEATRRDHGSSRTRSRSCRTRFAKLTMDIAVMNSGERGRRRRRSRCSRRRPPRRRRRSRRRRTSSRASRRRPRASRSSSRRPSTG